MVTGPPRRPPQPAPEPRLGDPDRNDATDTLAAFLAAVRPPLDFLSRAPADAAARTHFPAAAFATRGRALRDELSAKRERDAVEELCSHLQGYEDLPTVQRAEAVRRCRDLIASLGEAPIPPPYQAGGQGEVSGEVGRGPSIRGPLRAPLLGASANQNDPIPIAPSSEAYRGAVSEPYRPTTTDPSAALEALSRPVQFLRGVGPRRAEQLRKFGVRTIEDLLYHLPFRYEDRRQVRKIRSLQVGEEASVIGELLQLDERRVGRAQRRILEGVLRDDTGLLGLTWYHQMTYFRHRFRVGQRLLVHGKVERLAGASKRIVHPEIDLAPDESGQGILPVYNKPTTMTVGAIRKLVQQGAQDFASLVPSAVPAAAAAGVGMTDLATALQQLHLPSPAADIVALNAAAAPAHRTLVFDELFFLQLGMTLKHRASAHETGTAMARRGTLTERLHRLLPFKLTRAQERVIAQIEGDMARPYAMHRLVQGDVGCGKTVVALVAALVAIENGYQAAFMAPTELLAEQHFQTMQGWCEALGVRAVLLTGDTARRERLVALDGLAAGVVQLLLGTHALIQEGVRFHALGLGVIDEQHRFGVLQRAALRRLGEQGVTSVVPDMLLMTATPIPRTLAMTIYGDLDVSAIDELPPGRQPCTTRIVNEAERQRVYQLVRAELERGRQAYIVYPLVESSEKEDLRDATSMARELGAVVFPGYRVGLVHGRMKADEKEAVMRAFRAGEIHLLVSTTVIEVGVDVPNATIMVVEHAERFGLSQLHQLRGRVGRGAERATCVLVAPYQRGEAAYRRLQTMVQTTDGFRIAEADLELRGPGEFLGTRQSGLPDFRVANLIRDTRLLALARAAAEQWLEHDPDLASPESQPVRAVLQRRWAGRLGLAGIG